MVTHGHIYFVTDGEAIKIGFATKLRRRLGELQTSHHVPLFLLGSIPSNRSEECIIHRRFCHLRLRGEWFDPGNGEIQRFIDEFEAAGELIPGDRIEDYAARLAR